MSDRLTIAMLTSARTWRGSGVSFANVATGLTKLGHRAHAIAGDQEVVDCFLALGIPATRIRTDDTGIRQASLLARLLGKIGADGLLVDRPRDLRLGALASLIRPVTVVNRYNLSRAAPPRDLLSQLAYLRVALTIFVSQTLADKVLSLAGFIGRKPFCVIHEAVDSDLYRPDAAAGAAFRIVHGLGDSACVLAVGSLTREKRYEYLFDVWSSLGPSAPPLVICGSGAQLAELQGGVARRRLDVRFVGHLAPERLRGAYNAATCFVHAGAVETFGLSVLEAMACGRPVVVARGGALPEVVGDSGLVSSAESAEEFAISLDGLLHDPGRRIALGAAARIRAVEGFSLAEMQQRYAAAFEAACKVLPG
ncbi:MAG: glycosyltransferase family 4 protein [Gemmatimonadales bacterium]